MKLYGVITATRRTETGIEASAFIPYADMPKDIPLKDREQTATEVDYYNWIIRGLRNDRIILEQTIDLREHQTEAKKEDEKHKDVAEPD
jgi:hypothetical protein